MNCVPFALDTQRSHQGAILLAPTADFRHIDMSRFKDYCWCGMTVSDQTLNRALHAIADPTPRRILEALKEKGGCSIGKDVGLCASDTESPIHLSPPTISHPIP